MNINWIFKYVLTVIYAIPVKWLSIITVKLPTKHFHPLFSNNNLTKLENIQENKMIQVIKTTFTFAKPQNRKRKNIITRWLVKKKEKDYWKQCHLFEPYDKRLCRMAYQTRSNCCASCSRLLFQPSDRVKPFCMINWYGSLYEILN